MRLCNLLFQYFLIISFCYCHDLNHADKVTIKQSESTPSTPVQTQTEEKPIPSTTDIIKNIPISDDRLQEENSSTQTQSHIPSPSNSNLKPDQHSQTIPASETSIVQNESHSSQVAHSSPTKQQPNARIHPRNIQLNQPQPEDIPTTDDNQSENATIENKTQTNNTNIPNPISTLNQTDPETNQSFTQVESKITEDNHSIPISSISREKNRQICWHLPRKFEPSIELLENQIFRFINILPEFLQTILFGPINDREILMNTMWFSSICTMCFLFSFCFLSMGTKRLKQTKHEKEVRARCQQLQQYNNQIELERATFERQNQKLTDEIDELKNLPIRDADEDVFTLRTECNRFQDDMKTVRIERDILQQDIDYKQNLIQKYEYDLKGQVEIVAHFNHQIIQLKQELEKEREIIIRLQSNNLSLEHFEKSEEIIEELKNETRQLKQEKFNYKDQLKDIHEHSNQLDIENNQLTLRMKQLKDLFEQRNLTIKNIYEKIQTVENIESEDLLLVITENSSKQDFLSTIDQDIQKSTQHIHDLHSQIHQKTNRIKELEILCKQEKDHSKEIETKLKVVLELRERDAHLHIRQLGQTDAELRKARTDTDRVRILQQQLELKQQQLNDIQKVLSTEQMKFNEECSKLQHDTHEKWMEVKRLTRELDASKKECEGLRRQITKYANHERSSQEKTMIKPLPQHFGETETNGSSPISYQQGEYFRPIDHQRTDSGATSPSEMFIPRPSLFGLSRPPFFPAGFLPPPPPNSFIMHPRFPMPASGPHGILSPLSHLITNNSDGNSSGIMDSSNYDTHSIGAIVSPAPDDEKPKKAKKSLKKKSRTSVTKENV